MAALREMSPDSPVEAVATAISAPVLRDLGVDGILTYGDEVGARKVIGQMRSRRCQAAGLVYCGPGFSGHLKLEALALFSGARHIHRYAPQHRSRVGRFRLACSVAWKAGQVGLGAVVAGLLCGTAFVCLRLRQLLAGGRRADRA
jgi:hypothetical protein